MSIGAIGSARAPGRARICLVATAGGGFSFTDVRNFDRVVGSVIARRRRRLQKAGRSRTESSISTARGQSRGELAADNPDQAGSRERLRWPAYTWALACQPALAVSTAADAAMKSPRERVGGGPRPHRARRWHRPRRGGLDARCNVGRHPEKAARRPRADSDGGPVARRSRYGGVGAPAASSKRKPNSRPRSAMLPRPSASRTKPACSPTWRRSGRSASRTCWTRSGVERGRRAGQGRRRCRQRFLQGATCLGQRWRQSRISSAAARVARFEAELERSFVGRRLPAVSSTSCPPRRNRGR